ncbi:MAG: YdcF family protein [Kiritimatiellae bacterium]|nr:YdcF family protein [Kiritimatiellia bacterium]
MSYWINKIVDGVASPVGVCLMLVAASLAAGMLRRRQCAMAASALAFIWLWFWGTNGAVRIFAQPLDACETVAVADLPEADAVLILGGGMTVNAHYGVAEMYSAADRVWQGARVYRAGKARRVVLTGAGTLDSTVPLLVDLGVPQAAISIYDTPRNTEEEAGRIKEEFGPGAKIILVTSAWHMRRALLLFRRAGLDVVPCAADYDMSLNQGLPLDYKDFRPAADALLRNSMAFKEWIANFGYRLLRR